MEIRTGLSFDDILLQPKKNPLRSRLDTDLETQVTRHYKISIPIISSPMPCVTEEYMVLKMRELGGLGILHRFASPERRKEMVVNVAREQMDLFKSGNYLVAAAVGVGENEYDISKKLIKNGANILFIDVAHAHSILATQQLKELKRYRDDIEYIVGNVATFNGAMELMTIGADAVRIGIGGGMGCTTRVQTGHGIPNLTCVMDTEKARRLYNEKGGDYIPLIMDGGIRNSGDIVKSLAFGADCVSLGYLLTDTDASPQLPVELDGKKYKEYYGQASELAQRRHRNGLKKGTAPEGKNMLIPYTGRSIEDTVLELTGGIRSGLTYSGAKDIDELRKNSTAIQLTYGATIESKLR